jgi:hypothetical protein
VAVAERVIAAWTTLAYRFPPAGHHFLTAKPRAVEAAAVVEEAVEAERVIAA